MSVEAQGREQLGDLDDLSVAHILVELAVEFFRGFLRFLGEFRLLRLLRLRGLLGSEILRLLGDRAGGLGARGDRDPLEESEVGDAEVGNANGGERFGALDEGRAAGGAFGSVFDEFVAGAEGVLGGGVDGHRREGVGRFEERNWCASVGSRRAYILELKRC